MWVEFLRLCALIPAMPRSIVLAFLALISAGAANTARADSSALAEQTALAQKRSESAFDALSDRYTEIWARLPAVDRAQFSAQERAWLNEGRWQEQRACVSALGGESSALAKAICAAEVTERRLARLATLVLARH